MKRLVLPVVLGALALAATGCDLSPPAATVDGVSISQQALNAVLTSGIGTSVDAGNIKCAQEIQSGSDVSPQGVGTESDGVTPNAVTTSFAAGQLEELILQKLEQLTLARRHATVTPADVTAAEADYESQLQQQQAESGSPTGCTLTTTSSLAAQLPRAFLRQRATSLADQEIFEVVIGHVDLSTTALEAYYTAHLADVTQECLNLVIADSAAAAQTIRNQIAAGESFAAASTSSSADTQVTPSGGELQCVYPSQLNGQLGTALGLTVDALDAGQLSEPLTWQTSNPTTGEPETFYLVVQMRQHQIVPFASLRASIREAVLEQHASVVGTTLNHMVARAQIEVDPRYGTWSAKHGVTVPTPPPPAFVLNPTVDVPAAPLGASGLDLTPSSG